MHAFLENPGQWELFSVRLAGEPQRLRSVWLNGMKKLPVRYG